MTKQVLKIISLYCISVLMFSNCSSNDENSVSDNEALIKVDSIISSVDSSKMTELDNETSYTLPSALQMASIFKKSGLKFIPGITNTADNVKNYNSSNYSRAINLGIYSSDLAYVLLNKQSNDSKVYLKACKDISAQLGLNKAFEDNNLLQRFDKNIGREDSLLEIVADIQMETDILLEENKQKHITVIAFAGAWVETVYIAAKVYSIDKNKKVSFSLMEQFTIVRNIIKALRVNEEKESEIKDLSADIMSILNVFENTESIKKAAKKEDEADFSKVILSDEEFAVIEARIVEVRTKLVK